MDLGCMLVSVIVPVYNAEAWLPACLESVLSQSYNNFEILIVDDHSTDDSYNIAQLYSVKDKRIFCYSNFKKGVSAARNVGMLKAQGEYLLFLDSDDIIEKSYIEDMVSAMQHAEMVLCGITLRYAEEKREERFEVDSRCYSQQEFVKNILDAIPFLLISAVCCKCYKRQIIQKMGLLFPEDVSIGEDCLFNIEYIRCCSIIRTIEGAGYVYIKGNNESLTSIIQTEVFDAQTRILKSFCQLYEENGLKKYKKKIKNEWFNQICVVLKKMSDVNVGLDYFLKVCEPLRDNSVMDLISTTSIKGLRKKVVLILIKLSAFKLIWYMLGAI